MSCLHLPRDRVVNGRLMSEPSLDPPEDPPEAYDDGDDGSPVLDCDDFDDFDDGYPEAFDIDCEYWSRTI